MGSGAKPSEAGEFRRIFVLKVTLKSVRLILTVRTESYRKKLGEQDVLLAPQTIQLGSNCSGRSPVPATTCKMTST